jgi:dTDP-4-dehydrorhamnose 3,5-epimerase
MELEDLPLEGAYLIKSKPSLDTRGIFLKTYHKGMFDELGLQFDFQETYYSVSKKDVIRGMHFQTPPADHQKIVYVTDGEILDILLDLRKKSRSYGKFITIKLNELGSSIYIPKGLAHGFLTLSESATVVYNVSSVYSQENDTGILWSSFGFEWPVTSPIISERDKKFMELKNFVTPF